MIYEEEAWSLYASDFKKAKLFFVLAVAGSARRKSDIEPLNFKVLLSIITSHKTSA
jgi:hypothetical protein